MAIYPSDELENVPALKGYLGTFWSQYFLGQTDLDAFLNARRIPAQNIGDSVVVMRDSLSRFDVPVFKPYRYKKIDFFLSSSTTSPFVNTYGRNAKDGLVFAIDPYLRNINILTYTPYGSDVLLNGSDFWFENGAITFIKDPSKEALESFSYWGQGVDYDEDYVWNHVGYITGINAPSSENYKNLANAISDASINGPSYQSFCDAVEAIVQTPRIKEVTEIVEVITEDLTHALVITDKHVYKCDKRENIRFTVGQTVKQGDWVTSTVKIFPPGSKNLPTTLTRVSLPSTYSDIGVDGVLTFENTSVPLTVTENVDGYTKIVWDMPDVDSTGAPTAFFDQMHVNGVAAGKTLANYLDKRPQPQSTQPNASQLPATINPADLLLNNILRNLYYVIVLENTTVATEDLANIDLENLKRILPPEVGYLAVSIEIASGMEIYLCSSCPSYDEWHFNTFNLRTPFATDNLILTPYGGGVCGQNTVKNTLLTGLNMPGPYVNGAGESITIKPSAGYSSGAGGSIIIQPGTGVGAADGVAVIKAAATDTLADLIQIKKSNNDLVGKILNHGNYVANWDAATVSANTDNLLLNKFFYQRINCTGSYYVRGIYFDTAHQDGLSTYLYNTGSGNLKLKHNDAAATAGNRFYVNKELADPDPDLTLVPNDFAFLIYDATDNGSGGPGWRVG